MRRRRHVDVEALLHLIRLCAGRGATMPELIEEIGASHPTIKRMIVDARLLGVRIETGPPEYRYRVADWGLLSRRAMRAPRTGARAAGR